MSNDKVGGEALPDLLTKAQLWKRLRCLLTLAHFDPPVILVAQRIFVCKRCGKVLR